jgi:metal-responsive CopG/Arc/MetJ family transcriptional regulator
MKSSNMNATKGRKAKGRSAVAARRVSAKKVVADFPTPLFERTEQAAQELSMNRSRLIRLAVEVFLRRRDRQKLERAIAESLEANAATDAELMEEFKHVDADTAAL